MIEYESNKKKKKTKRNRTALGKVECGLKEKTFVIDDKGKSIMIDIKQLPRRMQQTYNKVSIKPCCMHIVSNVSLQAELNKKRAQSEHILLSQFFDGNSNCVTPKMYAKMSC